MKKNEISYEWDYETLDAEGEDILDHNHADKLSQYSADRLEQYRADKVTNALVLIRDEGNEDDGLQERHWAYVKDGKLPNVFQDSRGLDTIYRVPKRFHHELETYLKTKK